MTLSYPQFQAAADYLGALSDSDYASSLSSVSYTDRNRTSLDDPVKLNFMNFDVSGSAMTYDSCRLAPDSASTATSIATGYKTYSGMINVDISGSVAYETIVGSFGLVTVAPLTAITSGLLLSGRQKAVLKFQAVAPEEFSPEKTVILCENGSDAQ